MKMKKILVWLILILSGFYVGAVTGVILVDLWSPQSIAPVRGYILVGLYLIPLIAELILLPVVRRGHAVIPEGPFFIQDVVLYPNCFVGRMRGCFPRFGSKPMSDTSFWSGSRYRFWWNPSRSP